MNNTDLVFKNGKKNSTIIFQTPEAINILNSQPKEFKDLSYGNDKCRKVDIELGQLNRILAFAISHNLTISTEK